MFSGKVVLITGASSGIGASTAVHFAKEGALLSLTGRNEENLQEIGKRCEEISGVEPLLVTGDVTIDDDLKNILNVTIEAYERLDILVNNAGKAFPATIGDPYAIEAYDKTFATNVRATYLLTNLATPSLIEAQGNVVNVSSMLSVRTTNYFSAYNMSKAALDHFTRSAAAELAPKKVRVNSVNPGVIETNFQTNAGYSEDDIERLKARARITHPIGRIGQAEDVAKAILFLASDQASFITGETLFVDGGFTATSHF